MKQHLEQSRQLFEQGCNRALGLKAIYDYLCNVGPIALNCDDILRSALVLAVGSFDLYMHDVFRLEALGRLSSAKDVSFLKVPFGAMITSGDQRHCLLDECIRRDNAYKSFVAPDKVAECLKPFVENPWELISSYMGKSAALCKSDLRRVVDLRNRIAHEADVNPNYGGLELWPIYGADVVSSITLLKDLATAVANVVDAT